MFCQRAKAALLLLCVAFEVVYALDDLLLEVTDFASLQDAESQINGANTSIYDRATITIPRNTVIVATYFIVFNSTKAGFSITLRAADGEGDAPVLDCQEQFLNATPLTFLGAGNHTVDGITFQNCVDAGALLFDLADSNQAVTSSTITLANCDFLDSSSQFFPTDPPAEGVPALNYTGVVQVVGAGVNLFVNNVGMARNHLLNWQGGETSIYTPGVTALATDLFGGGSVTVQDLRVVDSDGEHPGLVSSSVAFRCLDYFNPQYGNSSTGTCRVQVDGAVFNSNWATAFAGMHVMCGGMRCEVELNNLTVTSNQFKPANESYIQYLYNFPPDPAFGGYRCAMYTAAMVYVSDYAADSTTRIVNSIFSDNIGTALAMDLCGAAAMDVAISGSVFHNNLCGPCAGSRTEVTRVNYGGPAFVALGLGMLNITATNFTNNGNTEVMGAVPDGFAPFLTAASALQVTNAQQVNMEDVLFLRNRAPLGGGMIMETKPQAARTNNSLSMRNCAFEDNAKTDDNIAYATASGTFYKTPLGGAGLLLVAITTATIKQTTFVGNLAPGAALRGGGASMTDVGTVLLDDVTFFNNSAPQGGGLNVMRTLTTGAALLTITLSNCNFSENHALNQAAYFATDGGGLKTTGLNSTTILQSTFTNNTAALGGALSSDGAFTVGDVTILGNLTVIGSSFTANEVESDYGGGGALMVTKFRYAFVDTSTFKANSVRTLQNGGQLGGAVCIADVVDLRMQGCTLDGNHAPQGGALGMARDRSIENMKVAIFNSTFINNYVLGGGGGGAMSVSGATVALVSNCTFDNNTATSIVNATGTNFQGYGGAIVAESIGQSLELVNSTFTGNMGLSGGAMFIHLVPQVLVHGCNMSDNGGTGGAMCLYAGVNVNMLLCNFVNNSGWSNNFKNQADANLTISVPAAVAGGGIYLDQGASLSLTSCNFNNNIAAAGGAIFANQGSSLEVDTGWYYMACGGADLEYLGSFNTVWPEQFESYRWRACRLPGTMFVGNRAYSGGALLAQGSYLQLSNDYADMGQVSIANIHFANNSAVTGGAATLLNNRQQLTARTTYTGNSALPMEGPLLYPDHWLSELMLSSVPISLGCGNGGGGGVCLMCGKLCLHTEFANSTFASNRAHFGGGIFAASSPKDCDDIDDCWRLNLNPLFNGTSGIKGTQVHMEGNIARGGAGAAIYIEHRRILDIWCEQYNEAVRAQIAAQDLEILAKHVSCASWVNNRVEAGGYGGPMASSAMYFTVHADKSFLSSYKSGEDMGFNVSLFDLFNQELSMAVNESMGTSVYVSSDPADLDISGNEDITLYGKTGEVTNISTMQLLTTPGHRAIQLQARVLNYPRTMQNVMLNVTVRNCWLSEVSTRKGALCQRCNDGFYSIDSMMCEPCPDNAVCVRPDSGNQTSGIIVPQNGYFHTNPFSAQIHRCGKSSGCQRADRFDALLAYQNTLLDDPSWYNATRYYALMCDDGYGGNLCGQCVDQYGDTRDSCDRCPATWKNNLYFALNNVFTMLLIGATIAMTLNRQNEITLRYKQGSNRWHQMALQSAVAKRAERESFAHKEVYLDEDIPAQVLMKVLISYLQVLQVLGNIPISYPRSLINFFDTYHSVVAVPGSLVNIECSLPTLNGMPSAMQKALLTIFSPGYVALFFMMWWASYPLVYRLYTWAEPLVDRLLAPCTNWCTNKLMSATMSHRRSMTSMAPGVFVGAPSMGPPPVDGVLLEDPSPVESENVAAAVSGPDTRAGGTSNNAPVQTITSNSIVVDQVPQSHRQPLAPPTPAPNPPNSILDPMHKSAVLGSASDCLPTSIKRADAGVGAGQVRLGPVVEVSMPHSPTAPLQQEKVSPCADEQEEVEEDEEERRADKQQKVDMKGAMTGKVSYWPVYWAYVTVSALITIFFFYETVISALVQTLVCQRIDSGGDPTKLDAKTGLLTSTYWKSNYDVECYTGQHKLLAYIVGIPGIILFAIGCPVFSGLFLHFNMERLGTRTFMNLYGFLYREYRPNFFFWESVILSRKLAITVAINIMVNVNTLIVINVVIAVLVLALIIHHICDPYAEKLVAKMELLSLYTTLISLYLAQYLLANQATENSAAAQAISTLIIAINAATVCVFVLVIVQNYVRSKLVELGLLDMERDPETGDVVDKDALCRAINQHTKAVPLRKVMRPAISAAIRLDHHLSRITAGVASIIERSNKQLVLGVSHTKLRHALAAEPEGAGDIAMAAVGCSTSPSAVSGEGSSTQAPRKWFTVNAQRKQSNTNGVSSA